MTRGKTWDDAVERWFKERSYKRSIMSDISNIKWLNGYLAGTLLSNIDKQLISSIIDEKLSGGVGNATVNRMLALLRAILNLAFSEWEWLDKPPKVRLLAERNRRVRFLTHMQALRLLQELPEHLALMAAFTLATGLRRGNVTSLTWQHVNMRGRMLSFPSEEMKSNRPHIVPLNDDAMRILQCRLGCSSSFVFTYKGHRIVQVSTAAWHKALYRAGIRDFRWHDLRHTWASWHAQAGTPLLALQELGGWESAEMVRKYAHFSPNNLAAFAGKLPQCVTPAI